MPTAAEHADRMVALAESLGEGERRRLVCRWAERALRMRLVRALEAAGHPAASELRECDGAADATRARIRALAGEPLVAMVPETRGAVMGVLSLLDAWDDAAKLWQVSFTALMVAHAVGEGSAEERTQLEEVTAPAAN